MSTQPSNVPYVPVIWDSLCLTDTGKVRKHNEDAYLASPELGLWAVADGVGGHAAGDVASQMVVDSLRELREPVGFQDFIQQVVFHLKDVNRRLRHLSVERYSDRTVASTVAALIVCGDAVAWLWVGDSRVYRLRDGELTQLTRDHTAAGEFGEDIPHGSGPAHALTRAIGAHEDLDVEWRTADARPGDIYVLCSDGLYKEITKDELASLATKSESARALATELMSTALSRHARDNITVGVVRLFGLG